MQKCIVTILLILAGHSVNAQVKLLTLNELEQRAAKGKDTTYVVNFWATWCGPCVEELPYFERLNNENAKKPFKVILMSLDFKSKLKTDVIPFVAKHKIKSEVYVVNETDQQKFIDRVDKNWSGALPATLILNTDKKVRAFYEQAFTYSELLKAVETHK
ncbi:TlpA disulfide reductase family protein [Pedobacter xixiisoli]|uniref:Thiol-disulfide isomerase or thioredoxin n=1 Tax=Pedobacter xixiisoli TaxID=1476464 RepID=A0A285ZTZ7_9SPHI|nr:TlpA disulfide reductase family protein [Pedobacter xixiisoli]SOD13102.1 Thiol-disulfide isomerase or thioredoxin [Pedobacter xixiisoli]